MDWALSASTPAPEAAQCAAWPKPTIKRGQHPLATAQQSTIISKRCALSLSCHAAWYHTAASASGCATTTAPPNARPPNLKLPPAPWHRAATASPLPRRARARSRGSARAPPPSGPTHPGSPSRPGRPVPAGLACARVHRMQYCTLSHTDGQIIGREVDRWV